MADRDALRAVRRQPLDLIAVITAWSAGIGAVIGVWRSADGGLLLQAGYGALIGLVIGLGCTLAELYLFSNARLRIARRLPPMVLMTLRAATYGGFIVLGLSVPRLLTGEPAVWHSPDFAPLFSISAGVALIFSTGIEITRLLGREATRALFTGRYTRPRLEDRVVLFADVVGSTALAEQVGELRFHEFLRDLSQDLALAVELTRGDVHKYVGDAVIVTWPLSRGVQGGACLICAQQMHLVLAARSDHYHRQFGLRPRLRVAVHCGQVAAGEIGDWKKEIALLGDTMNTTARIERVAKSLEQPIVLSDALAQQLPDAHQAALTALPDQPVPGKQAPLRLWAAT